MGLTVRSTNIGASFTAGLRSIGGGELPEFTKIMYESRQEVTHRMVTEAQQRGANAIVAMRFDTDSIGQFSEVCAYGTAVHRRADRGRGARGHRPVGPDRRRGAGHDRRSLIPQRVLPALRVRLGAALLEHVLVAEPDQHARAGPSSSVTRCPSPRTTANGRPSALP